MNSQNEYYCIAKRAPYLLETEADNNGGEADQQATTEALRTPSAADLSRTTSNSLTTPTKRKPQEADAAAGGSSFQERVSSFSNLLLTPARHQQNNESAQEPGSRHGRRPYRSNSNSNNRTHLYRQPQPITIPPIIPDWRLRDRLKTVGVGLIVALNCGTDPPDIVKPHPCAVLQCWMDPTKVSRAKAKELIGERLETQYAKWQLAHTRNKGGSGTTGGGGGSNANNSGGLKYRKALDPTVEEVQTMCMRLRAGARSERILLHYNGHGVPRPTDHGEIWVFDKNHTEYIPLSVADLKQWCGTPAIVVLDCSAASVLIPFFTNNANAASNNSNGSNNASSSTNANNASNTHNAASTTEGGGGDASRPDNLNNSSGAPSPAPPPAVPLAADEQASAWVRDTIVLCPCSENEFLPMTPDYPRDIFTSCLTTPIAMALRWFVNRNAAGSMYGLNPEAVDAIPGKPNDRKTPLGELNWIFTAVTDSIAWNVLPKPLFQRLFRQDLLVASMFRNFLLADRILRSLGCTPASFPPLPPGVADHPLWQAWDLACETLLFQLMQEGILGNHVLVPNKQQKRNSPPGDAAADADDHGGGGGNTVHATTTDAPPQPPMRVAGPEADSIASSVSSPFFSEQLLAFEVWLEFAEIHKIKLLGPAALKSPEHLPVVLQVLLSQVHRIRALRLLRRFLVLGPWAVNLSLSLGIFPYVMKLLQSPEYKSLLVCIWASILAFDPSCRVDVLKDGAFHHFSQHLMWGLGNSSIDVAEAAKERTLAAYVLAAACHDYPAGQAECVRLNLHGNCCALLSSYEQGEHAQDDAVELHLPAHFRLWLVICLANIVKENAPMQTEAYAAGVHHRLAPRMKDKNPDVRAAVCYAFGSLIGSQPKGMDSRTPSFQDMNSMVQQQQQQNAGLVPSPGNLAAAANMARPGTIPAMTSLPGQLQPTFAPSVAGVPMLQLPMQPVPGARQPIHIPHGQPMPMFQPRLHPGAPMQASYMMQGQSVTMGSPPGFMVGSGPLLSHGQQQQALMNPPQLHQHPQFPTMDSRPIMKPTVFEDRHRLELDLSSIENILHAAGDGSVVVRYEATVALGGAVSKYLDAFVVVAEGFSSSTPSFDDTDDAQTSAVPFPRGLERKDLSRFKATWKLLRSLQREDPFPKICQAANEIVSVVHESLLRCKMENEKEVRHDGGRLGGIEEEAGDDIRPLPGGGDIGLPQDPGRLNLNKADMRRVSSEVATAKGGLGSMEESARKRASFCVPSSVKLPVASDYTFPKSDFYAWHKKVFDPNFELLKDKELSVPDPLSPLGTAKAYQERRKFLCQDEGNSLAERYSSLAPKPPKPTQKSIEMMLEEEDEAALLQAEEEASSKKQELAFKEKRLLRNEGVNMTSLLSFHPYENYLMACGATDAVSLWGTESGKRLNAFSNGNPKGSRMTTSFWINEDTSSLFLVGCDNGAVKIWGSILESNGECAARAPRLVSAFHAAKMEVGHWGSGLVCDWQPYSGTLIAGGNSKFIRCWDLETEQVTNKIETNSDAYVTTLTTAWDSSSLGAGQGAQGYHGIGKDIVVGGQSDGSLKIFDIRTRTVANELKRSPTKGRSRPRVASYSEHTSWVVTTAFTSYAGRYELISGTLAGEIKAWDLRMSSSTRTLDVQRSTMTTLAVHSKIPVVATGSEAQFIKVVTLDGDTIQVMRYHEKLASHRIGPVSCLAFHPYRALLGAYSTDGYIGLYTTKPQPQQRYR